VALSLCGGGMAGTVYQLGCLAALEDACPGLSCNAFETYVGTRGGALLAAALAGGISVERMYRAALDPADDFFPLERRHLLRFDTAEWKRLVASATQALRRAAVSAVSRPAEFDLWRELDCFYDSLPAGLCNLDAYEDFLQAFFERRGVPTRFGEMPRRLFLPAYDLDTGERVVFGRGEHAHVPVARAVSASSAVPMLFAPVRVGDRDYVAGSVGRVAHLDLAATGSVRAVVVVNPLVPARNDRDARRIPTGHGTMPRVRDKGLMGVNEQASRVGAVARLADERRAFEGEHPDVPLVVLEPSPDDATLFMFSPMNPAARRALLRYGYDSTAARLRRENGALRELLTGSSADVR
jgi:NTE family protein